jgi:hypothetical protein
MKRAILTFSLAFCGVLAHAQSFPLGGSFIFSPKTGKTIAAVEVDDPRGYLPKFPIPFTKIKVDLTPFAYGGIQLGNGNNGAAGFGLKFIKAEGPVTYQLGGSYGLVAGDNSPHFGLVFGISLSLTPKSPTVNASTHSFTLN